MADSISSEVCKSAKLRLGCTGVISTCFLQLYIWQGYLQGVLEAVVQAEEVERQQESLLLVGSHRQSHQNHHPHLHLLDLRPLLQSRQNRHRKHHLHRRLGGCFVFAVDLYLQSRLRFPLLVVRW
jgi:hypothetical protein